MKAAWPELTLRDVCELKYGKSLPAAKRSGGGFGVFGSNGEVGRHDQALTSGTTIVVGRKGSYGEVTYSVDPCWPIDTTYYVDETATDADLRWLYYQLRALPLTELNRAAAVPGLNRDDAYSQRVLVPPVKEQRRIAAILDLADALREKRRHALAKLDDLTQAIFVDMFGDPALPSKGLQELSMEFRYGTSGKSAEEGLPALRIPNVVGGAVTYHEIKRVPATDSELERLRLDDGDLLFVRSNGNPDYVGRCAVFFQDVAVTAGFDEAIIYASYLIRARLDQAQVLPVFVSAYLGGPAGRRALRSRCKTSAGQYNLNTKGLGSVPVPVPRMEAQREFADRVRAIRDRAMAGEAQLHRLDALFASLQQRAFRGEL